MDKKNFYESPEMELVDLEVEQGFAASQQKPSDWYDM